MRTKKIVSAIAAGVVLPGVLLIGSTIPAAAQDGVVPPAAPVAPAVPVAPAPPTAAQVRAMTIAQYGVYPLPVPLSHIHRYHLSKKTLRHIVAARKLADTPEGRKIRRLESGTNYRYNDGHYFGAWNFDRGTWLSNGGGRYGRTADKAPRWAQDLIAWQTHKSRGWSPWSTA